MTIYVATATSFAPKKSLQDIFYFLQRGATTLKISKNSKLIFSEF